MRLLYRTILIKRLLGALHHNYVNVKQIFIAFQPEECKLFPCPFTVVFSMSKKVPGTL